MEKVRTSRHEVWVEGGEGHFRATLSTEKVEEGVDLVHIRLEAEAAAYPPVVKLRWNHPISDIHAFWHPGTDRNKGFQVDWGRSYKSKATSLAPVGCLYNTNGQNRLCYALSDALNPLSINAGVNEESAYFHCSITFFEEPTPPIQVYETTLRLDTRDTPYNQSLTDVQEWWAAMPGFDPAPVPETARLPMYSTWYSFHQRLTPEAVEEQCRLAKELGCEAVIVDDGWQTSDNQRGYAYCGDWEVSEEKIPDMRAHVERVHQLGMKYILWYSVPFVGIHSKAWARFSDKLLGTIEHLGAGIVDPRFPEVREYLISTYETAMRDWKLDGFKLDFVDSFNLTEEKKGERGNGRDYDSVPEAVDRLLTDVIERLRKINPDVMVEFRQSYIGPLMRKYGNMFRAGDCPNDSIQNRVRTLDVRQIAGNTATHADMLMWSAEDPVESAALQMINVLFSVPQISVLLDKIPKEQLEMVKYWLAFWKEHRDVLLDGQLIARQPELLYPVVVAETAEKRVCAVYQNDVVANAGTSLPGRLILVNGTLKPRMVLELDQDAGVRNLEIRDCRGQLVQTKTISLAAGLHVLDIPAAGTAVLTV